jgi:hypothetical protein
LLRDAVLTVCAERNDDEYRRERDDTQAALARLPDWDRVIAFDTHRARILALPDAISVASAEKREQLARIVIQRVVVADRQILAIEWTAPAQPFQKRQQACPQGGSSTRPLSFVTDDEYDPLAWYVA